MDSSSRGWSVPFSQELGSGLTFARLTGGLRLAITQLDDSRGQARLVSQWCELLPTLDFVTRLNFASRTNQKMFEAACQMPQLTSLTIDWSGITDLSPLAGLHRLRNLDIGPSGGIHDIEVLGSMQTLRRLDVEYWKKVSDFSALSSLTQLRWLGIEGSLGGGTQKMNSLEPIGVLTGLRTLNLAGTRVLDGSLEPLLNLTELRHLNCAWFYPQSEFDKLKVLPKIRAKDLTVPDFTKG